MLWGESELKLEHKGTSVITCEVTDESELLKHNLNRNPWVLEYQGVAYPPNCESLIFRFSSPTPIQDLRLVTFLSNYKDMDDVAVKIFASSNGKKNKLLTEKSVPSGSRKETNWS